MLRTPDGSHLKLKLQLNAIQGFYRKWVNRGRNPQEQDKVREAWDSANKFIKEAKLKYNANLGAKHPHPNIQVRNIFGPCTKSLVTRKAVPISLLLLMRADIFPIANKKLIYLLNIWHTINDNDSVLPNFILKTNVVISQEEVSDYLYILIE